MGYLKKSYVRSLIFLSLIIGCENVNLDFNLAEDINATESGSLFFEYNYIAGSHINNISRDYSGVEQATPFIFDAFEDIGLAVTIAHHDLQTIPQFNSSGNLFPDNDQALRDYAKLHDSSEYPWHLLSVDRYAGNQSGAITYGRAADLNNGVNSPPSPANERYSMIFTQDIVDDFVSANDQANIAAALITTAVHELGHQRAGLTDANQYPQYHGDQCVMSYTPPLLLNPRLCRIIDNPGYQTSNCLQIIEANFDNF